MGRPAPLKTLLANSRWIGRELAIFRSWGLAALRAPLRRSMFRDVETYVMFLGHPRSGHSLVGQLLNAHPNVLVAHELDALKFLRRGLDDEATLFSLLYDRELWFRRRGRRWEGYDYRIPGGRQDDTSDPVVVGDKKGAGSAVWLRAHPDLLERLRDTLTVDLRVLHMERHPLDAIATEARKGPDTTTLLEVVAGFFDRCETVQGVREALPDGAMTTLYHEELIGDTRGVMERLRDFLDLPAADGWLEACERFVYDSPSRSRDSIAWPPGVRDAVGSLARRFPFLDRYSF